MTHGSRRKASMVAGGALLAVALAATPALLAPIPARAAGVLPVAVADSATVIHGHPKTFAAPGVLANDLQLLGAFTASLRADVSHGTLDLAADGGWTYRSDTAFVGTDTFRYRIVGGLLGPSNTVTVTITVTNRAPVAADDTATTQAGDAVRVTAPGVLRNDADADGDDLTVDIVALPGDGTLVADVDGGYRYTPGNGFTGIDTFRYRISDGATWSNTATVRITVTAPPATPTPAPTPPPTPRPTASPAPTATPAPGVTPRPTTAVPTSTPRPAVTPGAGTGSAAPSIQPSTSGSAGLPTPSPDLSPAPGTTPAPVPGDSGPAGSGGLTGGGGGATGGDPGGPPVSSGGLTTPTRGHGLDVSVDASGQAFSGFAWAVPALTLTVPSLLLVLALLAQGVIGVGWLPIARRWLGDDRRARSDPRDQRFAPGR